jgi:hypothetical protein
MQIPHEDSPAIFFLYLFCFDFRKINGWIKNFEKYTSGQTLVGTVLGVTPMVGSTAKWGQIPAAVGRGGRNPSVVAHGAKSPSVVPHGSNVTAIKRGDRCRRRPPPSLSSSKPSPFNPSEHF